MKVTLILKNLSEAFYNGNGGNIKGLNNMNDEEKYYYLMHKCYDLKIACKVETGQIRDLVELKSLLKNPCNFDFKLEPRKGYKLATFNINKK